MLGGGRGEGFALRRCVCDGVESEMGLGTGKGGVNQIHVDFSGGCVYIETDGWSEEGERR